jgi:hypothetical protein
MNTVVGVRVGVRVEVGMGVGVPKRSILNEIYLRIPKLLSILG